MGKNTDNGNDNFREIVLFTWAQWAFCKFSRFFEQETAKLADAVHWSNLKKI